MTKNGFLEGIGLGVLAGAAIGIAMAANQPGAMKDMKRAAHRAAHRMERFKDDLTDTMGM